jgi:hypothetical protein
MAVSLATKVCVRCDTEHPAESFGDRRVCVHCRRADARERARRSRQADPEAHRRSLREYRAREPERHRLYAVKKHLALMGLTPQEFESLLASQEGKCAVCRRAEPGGKGRWHVDHDHSCCGKKRACKSCIRGLLCFSCNVALGYLGDDPAVLLAAANYLLLAKAEKTWRSD